MPVEAMNLDRFNCLLDAYGAAPSRWPEAERRAGLEFMARSPAARAAAAEAERLDTVLDRAPRQAPSAALLGTVLAAAPRRTSWLHALLGGTPVWQPVAALALAAILGLGLGGSGKLALPADEVVLVDVAALSLGLDIDDEEMLP
jgi:hypothetical protein